MEERKNYLPTIIMCSVMVIGALIAAYFFRPDEEFKFERDYDLNKVYEVNEIVPIYVTEEGLAKKYLSDYYNLLNFDIEKAYELLHYESRNIYPTIDSFKNKVNSMKINNIINGKMTKYSYVYEDKHKRMYVIDSNGNTFIFVENSIMDYQVIIK